MKTFETEDFTVTYNDDEEIKNNVFEKVVEYYKKHNHFYGEGIMQDDECIINAPEYFADIADSIIKFNLEWRE